MNDVLYLNLRISKLMQYPLILHFLKNFWGFDKQMNLGCFYKCLCSYLFALRKSSDLFQTERSIYLHTKLLMSQIVRQGDIQYVGNGGGAGGVSQKSTAKHNEYLEGRSAK